MGAALSNSVAGLIVDKVGFNAAFLFLAGVARSLSCCFGAVPETSRRR
jgi:hypothetical protein